MPRSPIRRLLGSLLPATLRSEVFEPAAHDLESERARAGRRRPRLGLLWLFLDCWRLAPAEVFAMFLNDLRHAFRLLWRDRGFTVTAVLTLTLGVGANVAVFAVVNAVLLRPLPYPDAERLVTLEHRDRRTGITKPFIAIGDYIDLHARQDVFAALAAFGTGRTVVHGPEGPEDAGALAASSELLATLGVVPFAGRGIEAHDARKGAAPVVMLAYEFWQRRFGGDPAVIGRSVKMGSSPMLHQVIGITPPGFRFPAGAKPEVIVPLNLPVEAAANRKSGWTFAVGRLKAGATHDQAGAHLAALSRQMEREHPAENQGSEYAVRSLREAMVGETRTALVLLLGAVGLVLVIACANVANLLAARSLGRRHEMSLRVALGAGRRHILTQLIAESLALAAAGGACAVLFAYWATPMVVSLVPSSLQVAALETVRLDGSVLAFAAVVSLATTVAFSLFSALGIQRHGAARAVVSPGRVTGSTAVRHATSALVAGEVALAIVLLTGAGLVLRSFSNLLAVDPGFRTERVLTANVITPSDRYRDPEARAALHQRLFEALRTLPGVEEVGAAAVTPLTGNNWTVPFDRADRPLPAGERPPDVGWQSASAGYFRALGIPLVTGRYFSAHDRPATQPVVIVSEAIQERFFQGESAVGRKVKLGGAEAEIVGVVGNIRRASLTDTPREDMYFPQEQMPSGSFTLFIRTAGEPEPLAPALRSTLRSVEPLIVLRELRSMNDVARQSMQVTQLTLWLLGLFAITAVALAAVGIYGVMSYTVRQRMREIGTRIALGATHGGILRLVLGRGARIAGLGTAIGLAMSFAAGQALGSLLFSTSPRDPWILLGAAALLLTTAMVACYIPARRATRVDPITTLRAQ